MIETWTVRKAQYRDGKAFGPASDRLADVVIESGISKHAADALLRKHVGAWSQPDPRPCSYCGEQHADGSCITPETAGSGGMLPLSAAERIAAARAELNRCTSIDGCTRPSLPGSMLCAEHVLAAHDAAAAQR